MSNNDTKSPREFKFQIFAESEGVAIVWDGATMPTEPGQYHVIEKSVYDELKRLYKGMSGLHDSALKALAEETKHRNGWFYKSQEWAKQCEELQAQLDGLTNLYNTMVKKSSDYQAQCEALAALAREVDAQIDFPEHAGYIKQICEKALAEYEKFKESK